MPLQWPMHTCMRVGCLPAAAALPACAAAQEARLRQQLLKLAAQVVDALQSARAQEAV